MGCSHKLMLRPAGSLVMGDTSAALRIICEGMSMEAVPRLWKWKLWLLLFLLPSFFVCGPVLATLEQGVALQEVKNSGWITMGRASWTPGTDPCVSVWEGVECLSGNVVLLNLTHVGLHGPVPEALGRLTTLTALDMGNNKNCNNCSAWNQVTGDLAPIANLVNLKFLCLTSNEMLISTFPRALFQLKNLVELRVDNTKIGGKFPEELSTLHNLQYLYLGNNSFIGTIPKGMWSSLTNLKELTFWGNQLTGVMPSELGVLVNLTYLNVNKNGLYGGLPPELGNLVHLERLLLYKNKFTGPLPDTWRGMTSLQNLLLNANSLYGTLPTWLLEMPKLSFLQLSNNQIYGSVIPVLNNSTAPALKNLSLECNYLQGARPKVESNITAGLDYNCWENEEALDSACVRSLNCLNFQLSTRNGECPACPAGQYLVNSTTCICYAVLGHSKRKLAIGVIIGVILGTAFLLLLLLSYHWWRLRRRPKEQPELLVPPDYFQSDRGGSLERSSLHSWEVPGGVQHFTLVELKKATKGFGRANEIGEGGFGKVFFGTFPGGRTLAIKRAGAANSSGQFRNEVLLLSRLHHKNLVRLEGFCDDTGQQILVYEFMKMGNLHSHLHGNSQGQFRILNWYKRLEIAVNVAQGLDYLHSFADPPVIHRDVKPTNILLDENLVAKVADFGISKESSELETHVSTRPAGTAGYFDPQYFLRRQLTTASDVYSFGVVLLELISGRKAIEFNCPEEEETNLIEWSKEKMKPDRGGIESIVDPKLEGNYPRELFVTLVELGLRCSSFKRSVRPTMKCVVSILEPLLQEAEPPSQGNELSPWPSQLPLLPSPRTTRTTSTASDVVGSEEGSIPGLHRHLESCTRIEMDTVLFPR